MSMERIKGDGLRASTSITLPFTDYGWHIKFRPKQESLELKEEALRMKWLKAHLPIPQKFILSTKIIGALATRTLDGTPSHKLTDTLSPTTLLDAVSHTANVIQDAPTTALPQSVQQPCEEVALSRINNLDRLASQGKTLHPDFQDYTRAELRQIVTATKDNEFRQRLVHGDLCMPNILLNHMGELCGIVDIGSAHAGYPTYDISILSWSVAANMGRRSAEYLLGLHDLDDGHPSVQRNRLMYDLLLSKADCWQWINSPALEKQRWTIDTNFM